MGHGGGEKTLLFFLAGWLQKLEADKHLSWSWMSLKLEDDDLDTELEPMQTCQERYFQATRDFNNISSFYFRLRKLEHKSIFASTFFLENRN